MSRIRHLDLFSGMGGFALAVTRLGHETVAFCDNDRAAQELLSLRWPGVPIHGDIRTLTGSDVGPVDLITGGFPCQPFSIAGDQRGADDDRHLWPEMVRLIAECRPRYVLGENVTGIIKMELDTCIADLEALGYTARALVVPAVGTDAPHRRERVWILAHDDGQSARQPVGVRRCASEAIAWQCSEDVADPNTERQQQLAEGRYVKGDRTGDRSSDVTNANSAGQQEQRWAEPGGEELAASEQHCVWPAEPGMGRVAHGVPRRVDRLRMLGNGIVPAVAYEILKVMIGEASLEQREATP